MIVERHNHQMFSIYCTTCSERHLVGTRQIIRFENTTNGPVADVQCLQGHVVTTDFGRLRNALANTTATPPTETEAA